MTEEVLYLTVGKKPSKRVNPGMEHNLPSTSPGGFFL